MWVLGINIREIEELCSTHRQCFWPRLSTNPNFFPPPAGTLRESYRNNLVKSLGRCLNPTCSSSTKDQKADFEFDRYRFFLQNNNSLKIENNQMSATQTAWDPFPRFELRAESWSTHILEIGVASGQPTEIFCCCPLATSISVSAIKYQCIALDPSASPSHRTGADWTLEIGVESGQRLKSSAVTHLCWPQGE